MTLQSRGNLAHAMAFFFVLQHCVSHCSISLSATTFFFLLWQLLPKQSCSCWSLLWLLWLLLWFLRSLLWFLRPLLWFLWPLLWLLRLLLWLLVVSAVTLVVSAVTSCGFCSRSCGCCGCCGRSCGCCGCSCGCCGHSCGCCGHSCGCCGCSCGCCSHSCGCCGHSCGCCGCSCGCCSRHSCCCCCGCSFVLVTLLMVVVALLVVDVVACLLSWLLLLLLQSPLLLLLLLLLQLLFLWFLWLLLLFAGGEETKTIIHRCAWLPVTLTCLRICFFHISWLLWLFFCCYCPFFPQLHDWFFPLQLACTAQFFPFLLFVFSKSHQCHDAALRKPLLGSFFNVVIGWLFLFSPSRLHILFLLFFLPLDCATQLFPFFFVYNCANATMPLSGSHYLAVTLQKPLSRTFIFDCFKYHANPAMPLSRNGKLWLPVGKLVALHCTWCNNHPWKSNNQMVRQEVTTRCHFLGIEIVADSWHKNRISGIKLHPMQASSDYTTIKLCSGRCVQ